MEDETFCSEWFRTTSFTRKRMIHDQLGELNEFKPMRLDLTPAERAVIEGTQIMKNCAARVMKSRMIAFDHSAVRATDVPPSRGAGESLDD